MARLYRNHISKISTGEGDIIKGRDLLKQAASRHFQLLFKEDGIFDGEMTAEFLDYVPSLVSTEDNYDLMKPFTEKEILNIIWEMELDKAPRPDGFSFHFYRALWNIIKPDLICMVTTFQKKAKVGGCTNSTFFALIPKEVNPATFDRFRPILLCNSSYKILANLLVN